MPREFRKRGKRKPKAAKEEPEQNFRKYREVSPHAQAYDIPSDAIVEAKVEAQTQPEGSQWPVLAEDVKAYWRGIDERIKELESLAGPLQVDDQDSDAALLLASALDSLSSPDASSEISLATDPETSVILERLLHSVSDFSLRALVDRLAGKYVALSKDRYASHVLETQLSLAWRVVVREQSGEATREDEVDSMTALVARVTEEISQELESVTRDPFASHVLKTLISLLMGETTAKKHERSKKSEKFRKKHVGQLRGFIDRGESWKGKEREITIPSQWKLPSVGLIQVAQQWGSLLVEMSMLPVECSVVQTLIELEHFLDMSENAESLISRLLNHPSRSSYLADLIRSDGPSHVAESLFTHCSPSLFHIIWKEELLPYLPRLIKHPVANYVLNRVISRLTNGDLEDVLSEIEKDSSLGVEMVDSKRLGCIRTLGESLREQGNTEGQRRWAELIDKVFKGSGSWKDGELTLCVLALTRLELFQKISRAHHDAEMQGALLLQTWLTLDASVNSILVESILSLPASRVVDMAQCPISSHVLDAVLDSPTVVSKSKRLFIKHLLGNYHNMADGRIGSRIAEKCWSVADPFLKEKIVQTLTDHMEFLHASQYGHFLAKKINTPLYIRNRNSWLQAVATEERLERQKLAEQEVIKVQKQNRKRGGDEIDELFETTKKRSKQPKLSQMANVEM